MNMKLMQIIRELKEKLKAAEVERDSANETVLMHMGVMNKDADRIKQLSDELAYISKDRKLE